MADLGRMLKHVAQLYGKCIHTHCLEWHMFLARIITDAVALDDETAADHHDLHQQHPLTKTDLDAMLTPSS